MDYLSDSAVGTANSDVAAALGVLVPMREEKPFEVAAGEVEQVTYFFEQRSKCGNFDTRELVNAWDDEAWHVVRQRHAWGYLRSFFRNRHRLRDMKGKGVRLAATWRHGRMELVTWRGERPRGLDAVPKVDEAHGTVETDSDDIAAALMAVGVPLFTPAPWRRAGSGIVYKFHAVSPCGRFQAGPLMLAWEQEDWWKEHREHPWAYVWCGCRNHADLAKMVRAKPPLVVMMRYGLPCFLPADAPPEVEGRFMKEFKR